MDWITVRSSGYIASQANLPRNRRNMAAAEFLEEVVQEFARISQRYFRLTQELPFIYHERQIHSVLLPAVAKIADTSLGEMPVTRKIKRRSSYGWIDYWVCYQEVDLLVEVKHCWHAVTSKKVRMTTAAAWQNLTVQLDSLPPETKDYTLTGQPLKVALLIVLCYQSSKDSSRLESFDRVVTVETHGLIRGQLDQPKPNWSGIWHLHQDLQVSFPYDGWHELYPCVVFIACISTLE